MSFVPGVAGCTLAWSTPPSGAACSPRAAGRAAPGASPEGDPASPGTAVARELSRASGLSEGARLMAAAAWPFEARFSDRRDRILVPKASHSEQAFAFRELGRSMESRDFAVALTFRKHS